MSRTQQRFEELACLIMGARRLIEMEADGEIYAVHILRVAESKAWDGVESAPRLDRAEEEAKAEAQGHLEEQTV